MDTTLRFTHVASGTRIAWASHGHGPVMVRVAHWMTHVEHDLQSPIWRPWLQRLGRAVHLVRYDERGCGLSGRDGSAPSLEAALEELEAVVEACGAPQVALLGQSGAAAPAMAYAVKHPQRVSHLVLLGGYLCGLLHQNPDPQTLAYLEAKLQLMALGWGRDEPAVQQFFTTSMVPDATREQADALNEQQRLSCDGERAAAILRARATLDVRALAPQLRVPTLVLHARGDLLVAVERGRELAAAIPGARFQTLETRNHIPLPGDGGFEQMCEAIADFVRGGERPVLTRREQELAVLVAQGLDNAQIGARLGVADKTVRNALSALYTKLAVEGRPQAIARIRDSGLG